ncbi:hypothetical protein ACM66B_004551 [Microbotryomycetes sp. NB124-2]
MRTSGSTLLETWATSPSSPQPRRDVLSPLAVPGAQQLSPAATGVPRSPAGGLPVSDSALGELKMALQRQQARQQQQQQQHLVQQHHTSPTPRSSSRRGRQTRLHEHLTVIKRSVSPAITKAATIGSSGSSTSFPAVPSATPTSSSSSLATTAPVGLVQQSQTLSPAATQQEQQHDDGGGGVASTAPAPLEPATSHRGQRKSAMPQSNSMRQSRTSSARKAAAASVQSSTDAGAQDDAAHLRTELASLGMMPADELFKATLDDLQARKSPLTLANFLQTLATRHTSTAANKLTIDTHAAASTSRPLSSTSPHSAFSMLETQSTPAVEQQQQQPLLRPSSPVRSKSADHMYSPRPVPPLLPPLEPTTPRSQRLQAFATIHTPPASHESAKVSTRSSTRYGHLSSASALSTLTKPSSTTMVAAQVDGMGRVALSRQVLVDRLGPENAEQAIAAAAAASLNAQTDDSQFAPTFGSSKTGLELGEGADGAASLTRRSKASFDVFDAPSFKSRLVRSKRPGAGGKSGLHILEDRLDQIRSWLASDDEDEADDEDRDQTWVSVPDSWRKDEQWSVDEALEIKQRRLEPAMEYARDFELEEDESPREGDSQGRVRVGGKSVRPLFHTKRQRLLADDAGDKGGRSNGKARALDGVVNCICGRVETVSDNETMVHCDDCRDWMHLDCLDFASIDQLPSPYLCQRCVDDKADQERATKRTRRSPNSPVIDVSPSTPMLSSEPTLVATSFSPRASGSFYRSSNGADLLLAPSPVSSPTRRHVQVPPRSPQHTGLSQMPVTPKISTLPKADYTPRSPLFYRGGRSRVVSGHFEEGAWSGAGGGGGGAWDGHHFGYEDNTAVASDDTWHDLTMTPSRTVSNTLEWETPSSSRRASTVFGSGTHSNPRSAAQDFLATLHHDDVVGGHSRAPSFNQRLFGSPVHQHGHVSSSPSSSQPYSAVAAHGPSSLLAPHSPPFSMKNGVPPPPHRAIRSRVPSVPFGLNPPSSSSHYASAPSHMSALSAGNPFALGHSRMPSNPFTSGGPHQRMPSNGYGASLRGAGHYQ